MEKRQENRREQTSQKSGSSNSSRNNSKKNKRRGSKKAIINNMMQANGAGVVVEGSEARLQQQQQQQQQQQMNSQKNYLSGVAPATTTAAQPEYGNIFWQQSPIQQQLLTTPNGQRLFTAVSDPTVCGYSPMPLTYTMEPVSLPPMYQLYQPIARPNYRNYRGRARRNHAQPVSSSMGTKMTPSFGQMNGYSSLQENNLNYSTSIGYQNGDYASLPPAANIENGTAVQELGSEHRRYSDPGLGPAQVPLPSQSDDSESLESGSSVTTVGRNNKLILSLIEQVTGLKDSNSQLFKELHQTKSELENVKMELNRLKQSNFTDYQPGMLSDIVREMREAARVREESLISKVKSMMNEKQLSPVAADASTTELDELKCQLVRIKDEKTETEIRLAKVEQELATLKSNANHEGQEIVALEEETLALRRELQEARELRTVAENHASKLEKLVGTLRKKMNVASTEETSPDTRGLVASGLRPAAASSPVNNEAFSNRADPRSTGSTSSDDSESRSNTSSRNHSIDNGNASLNNLSGNSSGLSGPVTDL